MMEFAVCAGFYFLGWKLGDWVWTKAKGLFWQAEELGEKKIKGE